MLKEHCDILTPSRTESMALKEAREIERTGGMGRVFWELHGLEVQCVGSPFYDLV